MVWFVITGETVQQFVVGLFENLVFGIGEVVRVNQLMQEKP